MAAGINVVLSLVDKITKPLYNVTNKMEYTKKQIQQANNTINRFGQGANNRFLSIAGGVGKLATAFSGISAILSTTALMSYANKAMEAAAIQEEAETKLGAVLQNVQSIRERGPEAWKAAKKSLMEYASSLQQVGVIGDEVTLAGMQQLATFQLNDDEIRTLSGGMLDLLAQQKGLNATGEDAVTIANMIGKAMDGNVGALSRVGITMSDAQKEMIKNGDSMQRAAIIAEVLKQNVGGVNKALAQTPDGKIKQTENAIGDMWEEFGKKIVPIKAKIYGVFGDLVPVIQEKMTGIIEVAGEKFDALANFMQANGPAIVDGVAKGLDAFMKTVEAIAQIINFVVANANIIGPVVAGIAAGFASFNIITKVIEGFRLLQAAWRAAAVAGGIFNAVMAANPIVLVALAIAALVAAIVALYMNWDTVCATVKSVADTVSQAVIGLWNSLVDAVSSFIATILAYAQSVMDNIAAVWSAGVAYIIEVFSPLIDGVGAIFDGIISLVTDVFHGNWDAAWSDIVGIFESYFSMVGNIGDRILGGISNSLASLKQKALELLGIEGNSGSGGSTDTNATGTTYFRGGKTRINEGGRGELAILPSGTVIMPHDRSMKALANAKSGGNVSVTVNIQGNVIGNEEYTNYMGTAIVEKVKAALGNM